MKCIKKLFNDIDIKWLNIIIFSVVAGIITGIIPLIRLFNSTSIHNIAECYEMWVLLAMIIILNSKNSLEAGMKTFVFFLISQPLCYLVQVPFYEDGFQIFMYYNFWFKMTLLTFPGAMLAWYVKKENIFSILILSVALFLLEVEFFGHFKTLIESFPHQLLACMFIIAQVLAYILIIFKNNIKRFILLIIIILLIFPSYKIISKSTAKVEIYPTKTIIQLEEEESYKVVSKDDVITISIDNNFIWIDSSEYGEYTIVLKNSKDEEIKLLYILKENESATVEIINANE